MWDCVFQEKLFARVDLCASKEMTDHDGEESLVKEKILNMAWCLPPRCFCGLMPEAVG